MEGDGTLSESKFEKLIHPDVDYITGEATATTMVRANPKIVKRIFPNIKIIALVRNPTDRFISHYQMFKRYDEAGRKGNNVGTLDEFITEEIEAHESNKKTRILDHGFYAQQLLKWEQTFGEGLRVIHSDQLQDVNSVATMDELTQFLNLQDHDFSNILQQRFNRNSKPKPTNPTAREKLDAIYHPHNVALKEKYGIDYL